MSIISSIITPGSFCAEAGGDSNDSGSTIYKFKKRLKRASLFEIEQRMEGWIRREVNEVLSGVREWMNMEVPGSRGAELKWRGEGRRVGVQLRCRAVWILRLLEGCQ
jgi:hypothetical protein